jgi:hypothetical protein
LGKFHCGYYVYCDVPEGLVTSREQLNIDYLPLGVLRLLVQILASKTADSIGK